ncbi:hypothetical protein RAS1_30620 [Phycisphaerae bacterium RAS1]|nr:hypothetical protein RAS1_30620 [Phycisphaerae bacterium RAS1]
MREQGTGGREQTVLGAGRSAHGAALIIGCGRRHRCDDQIGLLVAEHVVASAPPNTTTLSSEAPGPDLLAELTGMELLIVIDAAQAAPSLPLGAWRRFSLDAVDPALLHSVGPLSPSPLSERTPMLRRTRMSDATAHAAPHALGVADALELGETLGLLPPDVWVYAVAGVNFGYGDELSDGLKAVIDQVADAIGRDLARWQRARSVSHA